MYKIQFRGGVDKIPGRGTEKTYKFLLFLVCDGVEKSLSQASKDGYTIREAEDELLVRVPVVKLFTSRQGFGERRSYLSFYVDLRDRIKTINILSFSDRCGFRFSACGRFLSLDEVGDLVGRDADSYRFFKKQSRLSVSEMRKYVTVEATELGNARSVRLIRI